MEATASKKTIKSFLKEEEVDHLIVVPPDGGWGWVIVFAAFVCNMIGDGVVFTFGMFLEDLSKSFNVTVGRITLIGSVNTSCYYLVGPFVSALVNRYGFRVVAVLGSIIAAGGIGLASISTSFICLLMTNGVMAGIGLGMIYVPTVIVVGFYFEKWRALATGMATCGSGMGTMVVPLFITYLMRIMDWRDAYRILAGLMLTTGFMAMLYRPLIPMRVVYDEQVIKIIKSDSDSLQVFEPRTVSRWKRWCTCKCWHHNIYYPTTAEVIPIETVLLEPLERRASMTSDMTDMTLASELPIKTVSASKVSWKTINKTSSISRFPSKEPKCKKCLQYFKRIFNCRQCCIRQPMSRPLYRDDIFFQHSLLLLSQYKDAATRPTSSKWSTSRMPTTITSRFRADYHMSVTRVATHRDIYGRDTEGEGCSVPIAIVRTLNTMLDCRLLKSPAFQLFSWSGLTTVFGYMIPYLYIRDRATESGIPKDMASWLISTIGLANTVGRIISGILPSVTNIQVILYSYSSLFVAGIITALSGLCMDVHFQFFYAAVYGMAGSCVSTLRPVIVVELFGLEQLTNAFGLQLMFMGFAAFCGTSLAGVVLDHTGNYEAVFYMSGGSLMISAVFMSAVKCTRTWEKKKGIMD